MINATWPAGSFSAYLSTFDASIENSGLSSLNGSTRPGFHPAGACFRPPVHAGIVPSLLPPGSAPNGVSVLPSAAASCSLTAACAPIATANAATNKARPNGAFLPAFI